MTPPEIARLIPYLRRYARALVGEQAAGDVAVRRCLEAIARGRRPVPGLPRKTALFQIFHTVWREHLGGDSIEGDEARRMPPADFDGLLRALTPEHRTALLLVSLEGFSMHEAALVLGIDERLARERYAAAQSSIDSQAITDVLIVEDEPIVALDLDRLIRNMGHRVAGVASTRLEARVLCDQARPGLVLADIRLADGLNGLALARDIVADLDVPVIFMTACPEPLLTGEGDEPAFLVSKPYQDGAVRAVIGQALMFHQAAMVRPALH
jgi:CheY-like chemotaxis protein/DNA-directed RNA polymerase specialized sigma24 family protein